MKTISYFGLILSILFSYISPSFAWSGYDYNSKSIIEIGKGNLVKEGSIIQFYDLNLDDYITAKVTLTNEDSAGETMIRVEDLRTGKERVLMMKNY